MAKPVETVPTSRVIAEVADRFTDIPKKLTKDVISKFIDAIEHAVVAGNKVRIDRIGIIHCKDRAARTGRNPQTGEPIRIPASKRILFRASKTLKEQLPGRTTRRKAKA